MAFTIKKVANMIFIVSDCGTIFNSWDEYSFTERKLKNAMSRILKNLNGNGTFERTFYKRKAGAAVPGGKEEDMKTYYCVTSTFDNRGRVTANITRQIEAEKMPESSYTSTSRNDIYNDWFESIEEAREFTEQAKEWDRIQTPNNAINLIRSIVISMVNIFFKPGTSAGFIERKKIKILHNMY